MLFGRRKPGFDISGEILEESPKETGKPELLEYLASLPDAESDEFEGMEQEVLKEKEIVLTEAQKLAEYIRLRTKGIQLTSKTSLYQEIEGLDTLLGELEADETCHDIKSVSGNKDFYYYSSEYMSDNYAMIASLVEEKDLLVTIAKMVRFNSKTYPTPTPLSYFERSPYYATIPQIERVTELFAENEEYKDIQTFTNNAGQRFLFSTESMTLKYARALANVDEYID